MSLTWRSGFFAPAIVDNVRFDDSTMQSELFGPIFPVLTFDSEQEVAMNVNLHHPQPLAAYVFSRSLQRARTLIDAIPAGDAGINALMLHAASHYLPFGGGRLVRDGLLSWRVFLSGLYASEVAAREKIKLTPPACFSPVEHCVSDPAYWLSH
ncbi:aldehyde dehydrogenase family protein [Erwinia aphidicola]|nr:aldehyde dehydrogenase family protein [Erwinia aphidicola]